MAAHAANRPTPDSVKPVLIFLALLASAGLAPARDMLEATAPPSLWKVDWLARARDLERRQNWPDLLTWGRHWTRAEPANATAWFVLARANSELKRYPEAIEAYRQNLSIDPNDVFALNNLGNSYRDNKQFREALTAYRDALQINPDYFPAWQNLGLTFLTLKGVAGVTQALQKLNASDPELAAAWRMLIIEYAVSRDPRVAQKAIDVLHGVSVDKRRRMFDILFAQV
jgi:tetratricopeptide (TPR) repeat protein